nr:EOG090X01AN [Eurycercus lamellatus]
MIKCCKKKRGKLKQNALLPVSGGPEENQNGKIARITCNRERGWKRRKEKKRKKKRKRRKRVRRTGKGKSCEGIGKIALSAVKRATTQKCKDELTEIACKLKTNQLVPERLPNTCLRKNAVPGSSLGCFLDNSQPRLLSSYGVKLQHLTVQKCLDLCSQSSYPYAGVHNGNECYCSVEKPSLEHLLTRTYCSVPCDGQSSQTCGGIDATEVFDSAVPARFSAKLKDPIVNGTARIAFILTLNGRALRQVTRLIRMIYRPHHIYLIHVDARQDYLFRNLLQLELKYPNIRLTRKRHSSIWGGASLLDVLLEAMEQLLEMDAHWQFAFNLSESDFPLKSVEKLEALLAANADRNFLKSHGRQTRQFIHKQGLDRVFHQCESRMWRVGDRTLPAGIRIDGGSDWFGITRQLAEYATTINGDPLLKGLKDLYRQTLLPAESFFHVLVLNSKFCGSYADNNLRMTLWKRSQGCLCQHRNVVDWCGCSPMVFRTGDWSHLTSVMGKSVVFFGRKFEAAIDQSIMNRLEEHVTNVSLNFRGWDSYWESAFHEADLTPKPNSAFLAVATSLARHSLSLLTQTESNLSSPSHLILATLQSSWSLDIDETSATRFLNEVNNVTARSGNRRINNWEIFHKETLRLPVVSVPFWFSSILFQSVNSKRGINKDYRSNQLVFIHFLKSFCILSELQLIIRFTYDYLRQIRLSPPHPTRQQCLWIWPPGCIQTMKESGLEPSSAEELTRFRCLILGPE